ncbi:MAG: FAD-binding oxidoreductase [Synechococcus sp.]
MICPEPSELQELVRQLHRQASPWLPAGQGSRLHWGPPVQPGPGESEPLVLSTARLDRLLEHCVGDFTVTVQAGMPLQALQAELQRQGQWLAIDRPWGSGPDGEASGTVGGLVARGLAGGLRQRYLGVRDQLIGIGLLRADGTAARAGGKVVKNVAGYDLMRLFTGSWGSLGLITAITLRTQPRPPERRGLWISGDLKALEAISAAVLHSSLTPERLDWWSPAMAAPFSAMLAGTAGHGLLLVLSSISAGAVDDQVTAVRTLADRWRLQPAAITSEALDPLVREAEARPDQDWLLRLAVRPAEAAALLREQALEDQAVIVEAGSGLGLLQGTATALPGYRVEALRRHCNARGGFLTVLRQPAGQSLPAWEDAASRPMIEAVKRSFDPLQQLARGRLPGVNPQTLL